MAWWKLFWNPVVEAEPTPEARFEESAFENFISEPVRSIVKAMISDRKRFIVQVEMCDFMRHTTKYAVLDVDTEEEFFVRSTFYHGYDSGGVRYSGPSWASSSELEWAVTTVSEHYRCVKDRARSIKTARERNRLIEIYA